MKRLHLRPSELDELDILVVLVLLGVLVELGGVVLGVTAGLM